MNTMKASEIRAQLEREGWVVSRSEKHITYWHPVLKRIARVPHGRKMVSSGVMISIAKAAGWKWPPR
ncbi:putative Type II toxin-antitoxin system HicA family toxin [Hyphomicrobiales bacterium]|uniref:type II toxin-antitoxin system HicA family toxin n=1 Tax=unclassified Chelatococcus TaxID=2638111 RepID=UPI001BD02040|nr:MULTISPECIES: type II toxin-antitoxin system HicA family toxin [unclassified Chelatococcus]CAH1657022.1 putative Type II toxin-antitoxin system HicA family toxin [Hyphomicrobiales bacterium]MBS7737760.1 type II toxin-antitoxin system HicA family toxin [Chelatococcus sp. HY11]MBX3547248.1 type II toxin-antitoxin system HicA family toxin [Chelatococcus sp.]MCO5077112.1 type II toxin-antitoxin system HicA family toxin [Chelatococcus sp.]CAH1665714.1 putative Addiction module toxin, HicA family